MVAFTSLLTLALAAVITSAQQSAAPTGPVNPNTAYLTETDSNGVITGQASVVTSQPTQPAVVTSQPGQPAVVTDEPLPASIPALGLGVQTVTQGNNTYTVSVGSSTTLILSSTSTKPTASASGSGSGASSSSSKGSAAVATAAVGALMGAAGVFAAMF
jgi:hypothetical protein